MLSGREHGFEVSICPLPLGGVLEKDAFAGRDLLGGSVRESRRILALLQRMQASQQLPRWHGRQGLWCQDWNEAALHAVVERDAERCAAEDARMQTET